MADLEDHGPRDRRALRVAGSLAAWAVVAYFGALLVYGTYAWVVRASELSRSGNGSSAAGLVVVGSMASALPIMVVIGVRRSASKMSLRAAAFYGLGLSMLLLIFMATAFNI
ncbi:MAG: hypothetical protein ACRD0F_06955 [Acidimicrobiales bacterium]